MAQYDKIAHDYVIGLGERKYRKYSLLDTFFRVLGNVKGKSVLDVGCGEGFFTRKIKQLGADTVIGTDVSKEMIMLAKEQERQIPLGIDYQVHDLANHPKLGEFDIVTAGFVLHYSETKDQLRRMCLNVRKNLKSGGRFVGINHNPINPIQPDKKYDYVIQPRGPLKEGGRIFVDVFRESKRTVSFSAYFWEKDTYEDCLRGAGFSDMEWINPEVTEEGYKRFGKEFWKGYLKSPGIVVFECR